MCSVPLRNSSCVIHSRSTKVLQKPKTTEHSKIFQCNSICSFIQHIITVFLFSQCLSSYCTVFLHILRFPGYFETPLFRTFFHFPWDFEIAGFDCTYSEEVLEFNFFFLAIRGCNVQLYFKPLHSSIMTC